jgi:subtilase family serine protease
MLKSRWLSGVKGIGIALFFSAIYPGIAAERQVLHGHVPAAVARFNLQPTGQLPATESLQLAIGLPLRNEAALDDLLRQIYDPTSTNFHHYLTPEQFTERFGPTKQDYQAVIDFVKANGLTVTGTHPNRVVLDVSGSVSGIERALHVTLYTYRHPQEARDFYAPDVEPSIDLAVPILQVSGLNNYSLPHSSLKIKAIVPATGATPNSGSGPGNTYMGNDFRAAYVPGVSLNGSGQNVALVQFAGYVSNDIAAYITRAGLTNYPVNLVNVPVNGGVSVPGPANGEVCLDIEMVLSMAPAVSKIIVYEAPNGSTTWSTMLSRIANDNLAQQISSSWSGGSPDPAVEGIFKQMASQGQSFYCASGDYDAFNGSIPFLLDDTNITLVGGTALTTTGPGGSYVSESVWNERTPNPNGGDWGSSGGISPTYVIPIWQQGISMTANGGSTNMRNMPDVALTAQNVFIIADTNQLEDASGTSCAAPLWAGFTALANQQAAIAGRPGVGFINPAVYAIGKSTNYTADFHDTTTGDNTWSGSPTLFYATSGYDLCTGWGTPAGTNLINALVGPLDLVVSPTNGFAASGPVGGPFNLTAQTFFLTNLSAASLNWSVGNTSLWLNVSPGSGTLASGGPTTVTANLNSTAYSLASGIYPANVWFTNQTTGVAQLRQFTLLVGQPVILNGGFETGDFTGWTQSGNTAYTYVISNNAQFVHSGTYGAELGPSSTLGYLSQTVPTFAGQNYLLSLWMDSPNITGTLTPNEFSVSWNGSTIFDQTNIAKIGWTNLQFIVTATGPGTVLQLGFRDDPYYLGLDDINVTPIPVPAFQAATLTSSTFNLTWGTTTGLVYQVQYKTNLLQTNWINLGKSLTATNTSLTVSDTNATSSSPQRFYRLMVLP